MSEFEQLKIAFVKALPESVLELLSDVTRCKAKGEDRFQFLAKTGPVVMMALGHGKFAREDLFRLVEATDAKPSGESENELADAIYDRMLEVKIRCELGELHPSFLEFFENAKACVDPIVLLKSTSVGIETPQIVGYFNPDANFGTDWLLVDLSIHPDRSIRSECIMLVRFNDDYETGSVELSEGTSLKARDGWIPLYAHSHIELPSLQLEEESELEFPIDFPNERFFDPYESLASCTNLMLKPSFLHRQQNEPVGGVYAQLGGRLYPWVEESIDDQIGRRVVVRTYANAEPWIEVSKDEEDRYKVVAHIT